MGDIGKIVKSLSFIEEFISVTGNLSKERDIHRLLDTVINSACKFTHCDGGRVYMLDLTRQNLELKASLWNGENTLDNWYQPVPVSNLSSSRSLEADSDALVYVTLTGSNLRVDDVNSYAGLNVQKIHEHDRLNGVKTHSFVMVPLVNHKKETIGVLELINARELTYNRVISFRSLEPVVTAFASQAAICINNALLIDNNKQLIEILDTSNKMLAEDNRRLRESKRRKKEYEIIGQSEPMKQAFALMDRIVTSSVTVLLRGETGTGKEVFAKAVHQNSDRCKKPFVTQNCAALPEQLLESELFGYKKGAFTGAVAEKKGLFDIANGGTLFLDEIGDMPIALQSKLLRVLQEGEVRPLGSTESHQIDVRIIAATHCDLEAKIKKGEFREDLFFRLSIFPIELPPLRDRGNDVVSLAEHFIDKCEKDYGREISGISPVALEQLLSYNYPGNVRELQNIIERAVLLCEQGGAIVPDYLPSAVRVAKSTLSDNELELDSKAVLAVTDKCSLKQAVNDFECNIITQHLICNNWNQTQTAKSLQIPRRTLIDKMTRFNIKSPEKRKR